MATYITSRRSGWDSGWMRQAKGHIGAMRGIKPVLPAVWLAPALRTDPSCTARSPPRRRVAASSLSGQVAHRREKKSREQQAEEGAPGCRVRAVSILGLRLSFGLVLVLDDHGVLCVDTLPAAVLFCGLCGDEQRQRHLRTTAPCWFKASWARLLILSAPVCAL